MPFCQFFRMGRNVSVAIKNPSQELKNLFVLGSYEYLERLEGKIRDGIFFHVKIVYNNSVKM